MKITYPPIILLCSLIIQTVLYFTYPMLINLSILLGIFIILTGIFLVYISLKKLSKMETTFIPDGQPNKLVIDGPFRISRNPIYLGMLFILLGTAISLQSLSALLIAFIFFLIINFTWIKHEEEKKKNESYQKSR